MRSLIRTCAPSVPSLQPSAQPFTVCDVAPAAALLTRCFVLISAASDVFIRSYAHHMDVFFMCGCAAAFWWWSPSTPSPSTVSENSVWAALGIRSTGQTFCPITFIHDQVEPVGTSRGLPADVTLVMHPVVMISLVNWPMQYQSFAIQVRLPAWPAQNVNLFISPSRTLIGLFVYLFILVRIPISFHHVKIIFFPRVHTQKNLVFIHWRLFRLQFFKTNPWGSQVTASAKFNSRWHSFPIIIIIIINIL